MCVQCIMLNQRGFALLEVLIALFVLAFGLLGVAGLQAQIHRLELESYQRAQAMVLMTDMADRINANRADAASYVTGGTVGVGDSIGVSCSGTGATLDLCEWSNLLKGASEKKSGTTLVGAMSEARGCITAFTQKNGSDCQTGYQIDVIWLAESPTAAPASSCGSALLGAGYDAYRRAVSTRVGTGAGTC